MESDLYNSFLDSLRLQLLELLYAEPNGAFSFILNKCKVNTEVYKPVLGLLLRRPDMMGLIINNQLNKKLSENIKSWVQWKLLMKSHKTYDNIWPTHNLFAYEMQYAKRLTK